MTQQPIDQTSFPARPGPPRVAPTLLELRVGLIIVVWAMFVAACYAPTFHRIATTGEFRMPAKDCLGWEALLFGVIAVPIAWSANVFLLLGSIFLLFNRIKTAAVLGVIAALASASTWFVIEYKYLLGGSYIWAASHLMFAVGSILLLFNMSRTSPDQKPLSSTADLG